MTDQKAEVTVPANDELIALKKEATELGLKFSPVIKVGGLKKKLKAFKKQQALLDRRKAKETLYPAITDAATQDESINDGVDIIPFGQKAEDFEEDYSKMSPEEWRDIERKKAMELVRIRVTCFNPDKTEYAGEVFAAGNSMVQTMKKYVPFNNDSGWYVPRIIVNMIKERECQIWQTVTDAAGNSKAVGKLIKEFAVEEMPLLTAPEMRELALKQARANNIG